MMMQNLQKRHKRFLAALGVLALVATLVFFVLQTLDSTPGPQRNDNSPDSSQDTQRHPVNALPAVAQRNSGQGIVPHYASTVEQQTADRSTTPAQSSPPQSVTIVFKDRLGNVVPRAVVQYSLLTKADLKAEPAGGPDSLDDVERTNQTGTANEAGVLQLLQGADFEGSQEAVRLTMSAPEWLAESTSNDAGYRWRLFHGEVGFCIGAGSNHVTVFLSKASLLTLSVTYEDGEAYQGAFRVGIAGQATRSKVVLFHLAFNQVVEVSVPEGARSITAYVKGIRRGFREDWSFAIDPGTTAVRLAIPRFEAQTELRVDLTHWPTSGTVSITIRYAGSDRALVVQSAAGQVWFTRTLPGSARYYVEVADGDLVWQSQALALSAGETKELTPIPSAPFKCRLTVLDEKGNPLSGAKVHCNAGYYPSWYTDFPMPGVRQSTSTNANGVATITGLFAGQWTLYAEAAGFEPDSIIVQGDAGSEIDGGTVTLRPATSAIRIVFKNRDASQQYMLLLFPPLYGTPVNGQIYLSSESVTMSALPARRYVVWVSCGTGSPIKLPIETKADQTTELTIDLAELKP